MSLFSRGVRDYAQSHGNWLITICLPPLRFSNFSNINPHTLKGWPGDGAILGITSQADARAARELGIPVVNLSGTHARISLPRVTIDYRAIGRLAADHLLERGLRHLAYCGLSGNWSSRQRYLGFAAHAREAGTRLDDFDVSNAEDTSVTWQPHAVPLTQWLRRLARPVGLFVVNDYLACAILGQCRELGVDVPHEVALLGSDNDTVVCEFCEPTLSSVSRSAWRLGYEAAALLDHLMAGKAPPPHDILIPPDGVVARQSTDTLYVSDEQVTAALHFMRGAFSKPLAVAHVAEHLGISRRYLEIRFHQVLGCPPHAYLSRLRVEAAKRLLERSNHTKFQEIAIACGFSGVGHLCQTFQRLAGMTPLEYHRHYRLHRIR